MQQNLNKEAFYIHKFLPLEENLVVRCRFLQIFHPLQAPFHVWKTQTHFQMQDQTHPGKRRSK